jgi:hypothetical protein
VGYGLSVVPQNRYEHEDDVRHTSRSSGLLRLEASWARVFQSSLQTGGGVVRMMHVVSSRRSREDETEDRRIDATDESSPNFVIFTILDSGGISVF